MGCRFLGFPLRLRVEVLKAENSSRIGQAADWILDGGWGGESVWPNKEDFGTTGGPGTVSM